MLKVSTLITQLQKFQEKHGDLEVFIHCDESDAEISAIAIVNNDAHPYCCGDSIVDEKYYPETKGKNFICIQG